MIIFLLIALVSAGLFLYSHHEMSIARDLTAKFILTILSGLSMMLFFASLLAAIWMAL